MNPSTIIPLMPKLFPQNMSLLLSLFRSLLIVLLSISFLIAEDKIITDRKVLSPEQAFKLIINSDRQKIAINVVIEKGYYLYLSKFSFTSRPEGLLGSPKYSESITHSDEFFGEQQIFRGKGQVSLPLLKQSPENFKLTVVLQGCADAGVCYPPSKRDYQIDNGKVTALDLPETLARLDDNQSLIQQLTKQQDTPKTTPEGMVITSQNISSDPFTLQAAQYESESTEKLSLSWKNFLQNLLLFFLAGISMSLTACMYPLIPIVSSIIVRRQKDQKKSFKSTLIYTQGIAGTYAILGIIAGLSGVLLNAYLQQAIFIIPTSLLIVLLGLSMLDIFHLQLPTRWQNKLNNISINTSKQSIGLFLMGCISALIIGPCIAPPLAFALGYIGSTHNILLGALALYMMGLGMSLPLLTFSLLGDKYLPKAGSWMTVIKHLLGVLLLLIAVLLMSPFLPSAMALVTYSAVFLLPLLIFYRHPAETNLGKGLRLGASILCVSLTAYLLSSYYLKRDNHFVSFLSLNPLQSNENMLIAKRYTEVDTLMKDIKTHLETYPDKPIYLDFYADWCVSCKQMEKYTFSDPKVRKVLNKNNFFQIDITQNTPEHRKLMTMFNLYAPPGFFVIKAPNWYSKPLLGFVKLEAFLQWIKQNQGF